MYPGAEERITGVTSRAHEAGSPSMRSGCAAAHSATASWIVARSCTNTPLTIARMSGCTTASPHSCGRMGPIFSERMPSISVVITSAGESGPSRRRVSRSMRRESRIRVAAATKISSRPPGKLP